MKMHALHPPDSSLEHDLDNDSNSEILKAIEKKWQRIWEKNQLFSFHSQQEKNKSYILEMFPYPSGNIHMGHVRNYVLGDIIARYHWKSGKNVLHPMGWDSFGLPAENAAIEHNIMPNTWTNHNIDSMKKQLQQLGLSLDWDKEIITSHPDYYKYDQLFFLQLLEHQLVYEKEKYVNWDPVEQTVLANEQVIDGKGWRSGAPVEKKKLKGWFFSISKFAQSLNKGLEGLHDWVNSVKVMQKNWIGLSHGLNISLLTKNNETFTVFTTQPETFYGASFIALSPDHPLANKWALQDSKLQEFIRQWIHESTQKNEYTNDKLGIFTQHYAIHPFIPNRYLPIYLANFVLSDYGTGALFGCPAHDKRDFKFAKKYNLPIFPVVQENYPTPLPYTEIKKGIMINSYDLNGLSTKEAREKITLKFINQKIGIQVQTQKIQDWGISRQRYWGCPIPIIHCQNCGTVPVPVNQLPVLLPLEKINFHGTGNPLSSVKNWVHTSCPTCGNPAKRETDTMDTFVQSSWYFLRFTDSKNTKNPFTESSIQHAMPVDIYIGGIEHAVMHLLYTRFFMRALKQIGYPVPKEPFKKVFTQGMVMHPVYKYHGEYIYPKSIQWIKGKPFYKKQEIETGLSIKMSKSKKNVVSPDDIIETYGVDPIRWFIMSDTPPEKDFDWNENGLKSSHTFIVRLYNLFMKRIHIDHSKNESVTISMEEDTQLHQTMDKTYHQYKKGIKDFQINIMIASLYDLMNHIEKSLTKNSSSIHKSSTLYEALCLWLHLANPIIPHITEEIWNKKFSPSSNNKNYDYLSLKPWPEISTLEITSHHYIVQINGKKRCEFQLSIPYTKDKLIRHAQSIPNIQKLLHHKTILKTIVVPKKIINFVI